MPYSFEGSEDFLDSIAKLRKSDSQAYERLEKKMLEILEHPYHFKPLSNALKHYWRAHIGHFVVAYRIIEESKVVRFVAYAHHDNIYKRSFSE